LPERSEDSRQEQDSGKGATKGMDGQRTASEGELFMEHVEPLRERPPFHYNWAHLVESEIIVFILKTEIRSHPEPL
jgi:hypothetical protein